MTRAMVQAGDKQITASAWVVTDAAPYKILLAFHRKLRVWLQPGGHVERAETPWEGMVREVREETGIDVSQPSGLIQTDAISWDMTVPSYIQVQTIPPYQDQPEHYHVDFQYICQVAEQAPVHDPGESDDIRWYTREELAELELLENTRIRALEILNTLEAA